MHQEWPSRNISGRLYLEYSESSVLGKPGRQECFLLQDLSLIYRWKNFFKSQKITNSTLNTSPHCRWTCALVAKGSHAWVCNTHFPTCKFTLSTSLSIIIGKRKINEIATKAKLLLHTQWLFSVFTASHARESCLIPSQSTYLKYMKTRNIPHSFHTIFLSERGDSMYKKMNKPTPGEEEYNSKLKTWTTFRTWKQSPGLISH